MSIETAQEQDLPELLHIYARARELMRQSGNPTQWGDSWPPEEVLRRDLSEIGRASCRERVSHQV